MQPSLFNLRIKQTENAVEADVKKFMSAIGWRSTRNHCGLFKTMYGGKVKIGTEGFPDHTFTRAAKIKPLVEQINWEAKATGKKPAPKQYEVMASLAHLGEIAFWADSLEMFKAIYYKYFPDDTHV
jgi:hypothetical protein